MSKKRAKRLHAEEVVALERALLLNGKAIEEGPKKKRWTKHDLQIIQPLTPAQQEMMHDFMAGKHICAHGSAGTGKTFLAIFLALNELLRPDTSVHKIIIVRSAVQTRDLGFMPGTLEEKTAFYERPYQDAFALLLNRANSYQDMKDAGLVEFLTTSFIRGLTWNNTIVIIDEAQNANFHELNSIMTRIGEDSRVIVVGDVSQTDLRKSKNDCTGLEQFVQIAQKMQQFSVITFTRHDIVRSEFVKSWIIACEDT